MRGSYSKSWLVPTALLGLLAVAMLVPFSASAADRQEVTFHMGGPWCGGTIEGASGPVVRATTSFCGLSTGSVSVFCCEGSATFDVTVNLDQMRGAIAGEWAVSGNASDVFWQGDLRGRDGPDAALGEITGTSNTGLTFHGTWSHAGFLDPTVDQGIGIDVTGVVSS